MIFVVQQRLLLGAGDVFPKGKPSGAVTQGGGGVDHPNEVQQINVQTERLFCRWVNHLPRYHSRDFSRPPGTYHPLK